MRHNISIFILFLSLLLVSTNCWATSQLHTVFLNPGYKNGEFFGPLTQFMHNAASDLGIQLEVVYADFNRFKMIDNANTVLQRKQLPDYLILINEWNIAPAIMQQADKLGVNTLLFDEGLEDVDRDRFLHGSNKLNHWIGELVPNDFQAGWLLAKTLFDQAIERKLYDKNGKIHVFGINGTPLTRSSLLREQGLKAAARGYNNIVLHQVVCGHWEQDRAKTITKGLLRRYPETSVIWTASDLMAFGAVKGIMASGKIPNQDVITGGIGWAPFVVDTLETQSIVTSVGGHLFNGGWAMVMIYDHLNGQFQGYQSEKTAFSVITSENSDNLKAILEEIRWPNIDFAQYSKAHKAEKTPYSFGAELLLNPKN